MRYAHKDDVKKMATDKFSIDDAFQSDEDDAIRLYGSTNESAPLRVKCRVYDDASADYEVIYFLNLIFNSIFF